MKKVKFKSGLFGAAMVGTVLTAWTAAAQDVTDTVRALFRVEAPNASTVKAVITAANGSACTGDSAGVTPKASASARDTLTLLIGSGPNSVTRGQHRHDAPALVSYSRGSVSLTLRPQQYGGAGVSLYTVNGRRVLHNKISAASGAQSVSRSNLPAGAYMLSVKGANGSTFATKLAHSGGKLNINVTFSGDEFSIKKQAAEHCGVWTLALSAAAGYHDTTHTFNISAEAVAAGVIDIGTVALRALPTYSLNVNRDPPSGGTVERSINQTSYTHGTTVTLTARPESGYRFFGWSGSLDITDTTITVTMDRDLTLTAIFVPAAPGQTQDNIDIAAVKTLIENAAYGPVAQATLGVNMLTNSRSYVVSAIQKLALNGVGFEVDNKGFNNPVAGTAGSPSGTNGSYTFTVKLNKGIGAEAVTKELTLAITATPYDPTQNKYTLKATASPAAGGTVTPADTTVSHGAAVTVKAVANTGYRFTGWSGGPTSTATELPITVTGDTTLTANFELIKYTLKATASPAAGGTVKPTDTTLNHGREVTVEAIAAQNYEFTGWTGAPEGVDASSASIKITMSGNLTLVANFKQKFALTVTIGRVDSGPNSTSGKVGSVTVNGVAYTVATSHVQGSTVEVCATAKDGFEFNGWSGAITASTPCAKVTLNSATSLKALFKPANFNQVIGSAMMSMVHIEGGTFNIGCEEDCYMLWNSYPASFSEFYIGTYELTQQLWKAVMGSSNNPSYHRGDDLPVDSVSWNTIVEQFIPELNKITGKNFRLPTEAEWEYAARGGNKSMGYFYAGSNTINDVAWWCSECASGGSATGTKPVGSKSPNELGLYDMTGNVWEWVYDWFAGQYPEGAVYNYTGPTSGTARVNRGASFANGGSGNSGRALDVRYRSSAAPSDRSATRGFRLVHDAIY